MIPPGISIFLRLLAERSAHHHGFTSIDTPEPVPEAKRRLFAGVADLHPSLCVGRFVVMIDRARRLTHRLQSVWLSCLFKRCCDTLLSHHLHAFEKRLIIKEGDLCWQHKPARFVLWTSSYGARGFSVVNGNYFSPRLLLHTKNIVPQVARPF